MNPFVRRSESDGYWYVDVSRKDAGTYPGTAWGGYDTQREAFDAAMVARAAA